jgi:hypothetical protein
MTSPAEKAHVGSEFHAICHVHCRVRLFRMTDETHQSAIHIENITFVVEHFVRINCCIPFSYMTLKANISTVSVRTASQEFWCSFVTWSSMNFMTGEAPDFTFKKGHKGTGRIGGSIINGMMIYSVIVTVVAEGRRVGSRFEQLTARLRIFCPMATHAGNMRVLIFTLSTNSLFWP